MTVEGMLITIIDIIPSDIITSIMVSDDMIVRVINIITMDISANTMPVDMVLSTPHIPPCDISAQYHTCWEHHHIHFEFRVHDDINYYNHTWWRIMPVYAMTISIIDIIAGDNNHHYYHLAGHYL